MPAKPAYLRIIEDIQGKIRTGVLKPGETLPTKVELAAQYQVGTTTLEYALGALYRENWLIGQQGKEIRVADKPPA